MVPDINETVVGQTVVGGKRSTFLEQLMSSTVFWMMIVAGLFAGLYFCFHEKIFKIKETIKKSIRDKLYLFLTNNQLNNGVLTVSKDSPYQSLLTYLDEFLLAPSEYQDLSFLDEDDESVDSDSSEEESNALAPL